MPNVRRELRQAAVGACMVLVVATCAAAGELAQPPTSYPPCTAASLAGFPWTHPAFGKSIPGIALRNITLATCRVAGFAGVRAYGSSGQPLPLRIVRRMFADTKIYAYAVRPGNAVFFSFYGNRPSGEFDRSCVGITQIDIRMPHDRQTIDVTLATGTCGGSITVSQIFPVGELEH